jgi:hypothetical protein
MSLIPQRPPPLVIHRHRNSIDENVFHVRVPTPNTLEATPQRPLVTPEPDSPPAIRRAQRISADDSLSLEYLSPIARALEFEDRVRPQHTYYDDEGNEISRDQYIAEHWSFSTPTLNAFTFRHPRSLLHFLRLVDSLEDFRLQPIPAAVTREMLRHPSITNPNSDFSEEVHELCARLENHTRFSDRASLP